MQANHETKTIRELLELRSQNMLTVNPEYQRGEVWTEPQKKRLIDSVLRGYPIPLLYLHHIKREVGKHYREDFEVIDGQQRMKALYDFSEGNFKLFDPSDPSARFPSFLQGRECPWANLDYFGLDGPTRERFLESKLPIVLVESDDPHEAKDLFIRLQAGIPLNAQEKRDAWPGDYTDFVLRTGGKPELARYPGNDFFNLLMGAKTGKGRGKFRQACAQIAMLFVTHHESRGETICDISSRAVDDFYYTHLDFDQESPVAARFRKILDKLTELLGGKKRKRLINHEAIHLTLLVDSLWDDYTRSWEETLPDAFDTFRDKLANDTKAKEGEFWYRYGQHARTNSDRKDTIRTRHTFFAEKMLSWMKPTLKDKTRAYSELDREIIFYRDARRCAECKGEVSWPDAQIHHVIEHAKGGETSLANGVLVHGHCHPLGKDAEAFASRHGR
jgi:hypothetical protein